MPLNIEVGQKVHLGFSVPSYGKTQKNFLANPILFQSVFNDACILLCVVINSVVTPFKQFCVLRDLVNIIMLVYF